MLWIVIRMIALMNASVIAGYVFLCHGHVGGLSLGCALMR